MNVSPLLGNIRQVAPQATGQTLPQVPENGNFSAVLTNLMDLLKGLFDGPGIGVGPNEGAQDLGLGPQKDLIRDIQSSDPHVTAESIRDFARKAEDIREGLREVVEKKIDDLPYEEAAVAIEEIRRLVQQIDNTGVVHHDPASSGTVIDDIMRQVQDLQRQFNLSADTGQGDVGRQNPNTLQTLPSNGEEDAPDLPFLPRRPAVTPGQGSPQGEAPPPPETNAAPPPRPAPLPQPEPSQGPRIQPPGQGTNPNANPGAGVVEAQAPPVEPPPPAAPPEPAVPPVSQAAAASAHVDATPPQGARPGQVGINAVEAAAAKGRTDATSPGESSHVPSPRTGERVDFVERIIKAAKITQSKGQTRMRIVLNPPHLGSIKVQLTVEDGVLSGTIRTESAAARELILNHIQSLRDALEEQGINVGEFQVNVEEGSDHPAQDFNRDADHTPPSDPGADELPETASDTAPTANEIGMRIRSERLQLVDLVA